MKNTNTKTRARIIASANKIAGCLLSDVYTSGTLPERLRACADHRNAGTDGDLTHGDRVALRELADAAEGSTNTPPQARTSPNEARTRKGIEPARVVMHFWQSETLERARKVPDGTINGLAHERGMDQNEPIILMLDSLLRYAKAYEKRFEGKLAGDHVLGAAWLDAVRAVRALLNGDGALAMENGWTTDSKDNGACAEMFWTALRVAGFGEGDL